MSNLPPSPSVSATARIVASLVLLLALGAAGFYLWRAKQGQQAAAAAASQMPEFPTAIETAEVHTHPYAKTTTAIGTVRALQSITLRNELPGTVHTVALKSGEIVDAGALLVELDVAVETAELQALEAEARLAESMLGRMEKALKDQGASAADVDRARAEHDKALANVARTKALIERKKVKAPFRARVGMVDLHLGQYLEPGTQLTTLQGVDDAVHIDFAVTQEAAAKLAIGGEIEVVFTGRDKPARAKIVAIDARVDATTRSTWIRALLAGSGAALPSPGGSVRVAVPVEAVHDVMVVPVSALRRGPAGDHVFVVANAPDGKLRAQMRRITSGATLADDVVVKDGLKVGERVATTGSFKLRDGALLALAPAAAPGEQLQPQQSK